MSKSEDRREQLVILGDDQLLHIARNESAMYDYRLTAVEILQKRKSPKANCPGLPVLETSEDLGVYPLPEVVHETEIHPVHESGPLKASVTTSTMFGVQKMDEDVPPADEALISKEPSTTKRNKSK